MYLVMELDPDVIRRECLVSSASGNPIDVCVYQGDAPAILPGQRTDSYENILLSPVDLQGYANADANADSAADTSPVTDAAADMVTDAGTAAGAGSDISPTIFAVKGQTGVYAATHFSARLGVLFVSFLRPHERGL